MQLDRSRFKNEEKKLKKKYKEQETLALIIELLKNSDSFSSLEKNPISYLYGFEPKREDLSGFYGFNLEKNGGTIRLICSFDKDNSIARLEYISLDHYKDFKRCLRENKERKTKL